MNCRQFNFQMSVCLSATEDKRQKVEMSVLVYISSTLFYVLSSWPYSIQITLMPGLVCSLFFSFSLLTMQSKKRERENDDHHIIFVVTIEVCMWAYSSFLPTNVRCPFSFIIIHLLCIFSFCVFVMQKNWSYRFFLCILDWSLVIQGYII